MGTCHPKGEHVTASLGASGCPAGVLPAFISSIPSTMPVGPLVPAVSWAL